MIKQFTSGQFIKFLCTGGIAACVNFGSRFIYNMWMGFSAAIILAYLSGMITAFLLAKYFVFHHSPLHWRQSALRFVLINLLGIAQTLIISLGLAFYLLPALGIRVMVKEIAHAIGIMVPIFSSYIGHKYWSFSSNQP